jgi:hypothetical protein
LPREKRNKAGRRGWKREKMKDRKKEMRNWLMGSPHCLCLYPVFHLLKQFAGFDKMWYTFYSSGGNFRVNYNPFP